LETAADAPATISYLITVPGLQSTINRKRERAWTSRDPRPFVGGGGLHQPGRTALRPDPHHCLRLACRAGDHHPHAPAPTVPVSGGFQPLAAFRARERLPRSGSRSDVDVDMDLGGGLLLPALP